MTAESLALWERFPPRTVPLSWPETCQSRHEVAERLLAAPFLPAARSACEDHRLGVLKILDWLEMQPGDSWQDRWNAPGSGRDGPGGWRRAAVAALSGHGGPGQREERIFSALGKGTAQLIAGDVIRPPLEWLITERGRDRLAPGMGRGRDPEGMARLQALRESGGCDSNASMAITKIAIVMAAKGGLVTGITVGDCLELIKTGREIYPGISTGPRHSPYFYQMLHALGVFPAGAPPTVRMFATAITGKATVEQMVDRYDLACRPVRDLLVDYLRDRQPGIDYVTLNGLATVLALWF
jgi:hypothetical protein